ncbi:MAG: hypothetical protein HY906_24760 [Deltaproteobacteria bacterium]|nr:hypothetical protein [Deltaproteobacteria bacterium]
MAEGIDALEGQRCGGRMSVLAVILDPAVAERIVRYLGLGNRASRCRILERSDW